MGVVPAQLTTGSLDSKTRIRKDLSARPGHAPGVESNDSSASESLEAWDA